MVVNKNKRLSGYARFHIEFMGYDFYDNLLRKIMSKYIMWHGFNRLCLIMLKRGAVISRYTLVDKEGWEKGFKTEEQ